MRDTEKAELYVARNIKALKDNINIRRQEDSLEKLAEKSGLSLNTLRSLLYKDIQDCKLSTVIAIADAFDTTIDELIGRPDRALRKLHVVELVEKNGLIYLKGVSSEVGSSLGNIYLKLRI